MSLVDFLRTKSGEYEFLAERHAERAPLDEQHFVAYQAMLAIGIVLREVGDAIDVVWGEEAVLAFASVAVVSRSDWDTRRVRDTMIPLDEVPLLTEDETAVDALAELSEPRANRGLVVDNGHLAGLLSITDLARAAPSVDSSIAHPASVVRGLRHPRGGP